VFIQCPYNEATLLSGALPMSKISDIGLMVPINNTTMEPELARLLPDLGALTTLRIPRDAGLLTSQTIGPYKLRALDLAKDQIASGIDDLAYGCTAASFLSGPQADAAFADELSSVIGKPVVTTARAMVLALQAAQARKIAVVTPYQDSVNTQLAAFLEAGGIDVLVLNSFRAATVQELGQITSAQVDALARSTMTNDCDAMLIACSQLPTIDLLQSLQESFGRPVFSSIQSTAWQVGKVLDAINAGTAA